MTVYARPSRMMLEPSAPEPTERRCANSRLSNATFPAPGRHSSSRKCCLHPREASTLYRGRRLACTACPTSLAVGYRALPDSTKTGLIPVTAPPQYDEVDSATFKWFSKMMANEVTPKAALAGLDKDITAALAKPA